VSVAIDRSTDPTRWLRPRHQRGMRVLGLSCGRRSFPQECCDIQRDKLDDATVVAGWKLVHNGGEKLVHLALASAGVRGSAEGASRAVQPPRAARFTLDAPSTSTGSSPECQVDQLKPPKWTDPKPALTTTRAIRKQQD
jgi:hypothetical protein